MNESICKRHSVREEMLQKDLVIAVLEDGERNQDLKGSDV
jgi:hypothetical protein